MRLARRGAFLAIALLGRTLRTRIYEYLVRFLKLVYWQSLAGKIKKSGSDSFIEYPCMLSGGQYITLGDHFRARSGLRMEAICSHGGHSYSPEITIGRDVSLESDCHIGCVNKIIIGDNVLIASRVFITDHSHGEISAEALTLPPGLRPIISKGPVIIEENVWIGEGVAIMPNVTIGRNAIIGANSVVTRNVPPNAVMGGIPARLIRMLA